MITIMPVAVPLKVAVGDVPPIVMPLAEDPVILFVLPSLRLTAVLTIPVLAMFIVFEFVTLADIIPLPEPLTN